MDQLRKPDVSSLEVDGKVIDDPGELAEEFNIHFLQIADKLREKVPDLNSDLPRLTNFVNSRKDRDVVFTLRDTTFTQVISILKRVSPNKSAGIDKINARLLHLDPPVISPSIAWMINYSFSTGTLIILTMEYQKDLFWVLFSLSYLLMICHFILQRR